MAKLVCRSGPAAGCEYLLTKDVTLLGRQSSSEVPVDDTMASRAHCQIRRDGHLFTLVDLGSRNGTLHNGRKINERSLLYGDRIRIGECEYVLVKEPGDTDLKDLLTKYEIIDRLGEGGMGIVYKAVQRSMARTVALKVLAPKYANRQKFVDQFVREARAAGTLNHANIIQVHDVGQENGIHYFSMEYVDGPTCMAVLREQGPMAPSDALEVVKQVAKALEYAHGHRLIHQDIKPDNIMLTAQGQVKLADLGISKTFDEAEAETAPKRVMGTPHYMAPEAALGKRIDHRVDLYSLGATLYHLLTSKTPYGGTSATDVLKAHVMDPFPAVQDVVPAVPDAVCDLVDRMTAKDPDQRISSATAVVEEIVKLEQTLGLKSERIAQGNSGYLRQYAERSAPDRTPAQEPDATADQVSPLRGRTARLSPLVIVLGAIAVLLIAAAVVFWPQPAPTESAPTNSPIPVPGTTAPVVPPPTNNQLPLITVDPRVDELNAIDRALDRGVIADAADLARRIGVVAASGNLPRDLELRAESARVRVNALLKQAQDKEVQKQLDTLERQIAELVSQRNYSVALERLEIAGKGLGDSESARIAKMRALVIKDREDYIGEYRTKLVRYLNDESRLRQLRDSLPPSLLGTDIEREIAAALQKIAEARESENRDKLAKVGALLGNWKLGEFDVAAAELRPVLVDTPSAAVLDQYLAAAKSARAMIQKLVRALAIRPALLPGAFGAMNQPQVIAVSERGVSLRAEISGTVEMRWSELSVAEIETLAQIVLNKEAEAYKPAVAAIAALKQVKTP